MKRPILLQIVRDSIAEVFLAKRVIKKDELLKEYPLLQENLVSKIEIFIDNELFSSIESNADDTLLNELIKNAKIAAFEGSDAIKTSQYIDCEIKLTLFTPDGVISQTDQALSKNIKMDI